MPAVIPLIKPREYSQTFIRPPQEVRGMLYYRLLGKLNSPQALRNYILREAETLAKDHLLSVHSVSIRFDLRKNSDGRIRIKHSLENRRREKIKIPLIDEKSKFVAIVVLEGTLPDGFRRSGADPNKVPALKEWQENYSIALASSNQHHGERACEDFAEAETLPDTRHLNILQLIHIRHVPSYLQGLLPHFFPGDVIGDRYVLESFIGSGAFAVVLKAHDTQSGKKIALKIARDEHLRPEIDGFRQIGDHSNPHLVKYMGDGWVEGLRYLALEYIDGISLKEMIQLRKNIPLTEALAIISWVSSGLEPLAANKLLHEDLKPSNILMRTGAWDQKPVVIDLGFVMREGIKMKELWGTPHYMSPEQKMQEPLDRRSDIYALGIVFYEMLCGSRPIALQDKSHVQLLLMANNPPRFSEDACFQEALLQSAQRSSRDPSVQSKLIRAGSKLLDKMTAPSAKERHQDYDELRADIDESWDLIRRPLPSVMPVEDFQHPFPNVGRVAVPLPLPESVNLLKEAGRNDLIDLFFPSLAPAV